MATTKPTGSVRGTLPAELTSFVGRRRELSETRRLLAGSRMLTLTGVGGVGKTRLALRMAAEVRRTFPDGVWFVELAALHDPQLLPHTVANTLELRQVSADPAADLAAYLENQQLLVVLDNCEHLTDACAVLASKLLAAAPGPARPGHQPTRAGRRGRADPVGPAPVDARRRRSTAGDADALRVGAALPGPRHGGGAGTSRSTDGNRAAVVELCRRLDGIPLAIELAAVWLRTLSPAQILERLEDRFRLLTTGRPAAPARQQALDATVGWSYDLCSPAEQLMWARLSVFSEASTSRPPRRCAAVTGSPATTSSTWSRAWSTSRSSSGSRRPTTPPPGTRCWRPSGSTAPSGSPSEDQVRALRIRHRDHYRSLAEQFAAEGFGPRQADWFIRLRRESGNLRAALEFCLGDERDGAAALDIAAPIWNFWFAGFLREGYRYLIRALDLATEPTRGRAYGLWAASYLAMFATEFERNATMLAECVEIAGRARRRPAAGAHQGVPGPGHPLPGGPAGRHRACSSRPAREFRAIGDPLGEFDTLILLSAATFFLDDPRADEFSRQALALAEQHGAQSSRAYALLERRHRAVARRRLRPGDAVAAGVRSGCSSRCTT